MAVCKVCFRHCNIPEGGLGFCGARTCIDGEVTAANYGRVTSLALDPIEKKPLARFHPGSMILSAGSYGCNLRCPFCQNYQISWSEEAYRFADSAEYISPEEMAGIALSCRDRGNIGVAFTYNEPLIGYEYIFTDRYYNEVLGGDRAMTMAFIEEAVKHCHVELTTLIVPGENDSEDEIRSMTEWIAGLKDADGNTIGEEIPLHISRFFPRFHMTDRDATKVRLVYMLADVAREKLRYVYTGNC